MADPTRVRTQSPAVEALAPKGAPELEDGEYEVAPDGTLRRVK